MANKDIYKEPKTAEVKTLRKKIASLEHEIRRLKSELKTYDAAFSKSVVFLKDSTEEFSVEELIEGAKRGQKVEDIREEKELKMSELVKKWGCHKEDCDGVLKLLFFPGNRYRRKCSICNNGTEVQSYENIDEVEGVR